MTKQRRRKHTRFAASAMGRVLALMRRGTMDRTVIANRLDLSIRKVATAQKNLRRDGFIQPVGEKRRGGSRPSVYIVVVAIEADPLLGISSIFNHRAAG